MSNGPAPEESPVTQLSESECWRRLRLTRVGRVAMHAERLEIFPINFVVDGGTVVFRTAVGTKLSALAQSATVVFEADYWSESGDEPVWSVVIHGQAKHLNSFDLLDTAQLPLFPMHLGSKEHFVRITPEEVAGRQFDPTPPQSWTSPLPNGPRSAAE